jgi:SanA protein
MRLRWIFLILFVFILSLVILANNRIERSSRNSVFKDAENIPHNRVGLLLGTSKYLNSGQPNQYFNNRIKAANNLFIAKKIDYIVISGDNSKNNYNEPQDMKNELVSMGIPDSLIILDYAGFRTYDSVIRLDKVFGQKSFTIISQEFHNERAIYISKRMGLTAVGYNAEDVDRYTGLKTNMREKLARVKVFLDLMFHKKPKYLGDKIEIK